jgi:hypothetical protein
VRQRKKRANSLRSDPAEPIREVGGFTLFFNEGSGGRIPVNGVAVAEGAEVGHSVASALDEARGWEFIDAVRLRFGMELAAGNGATMDDVGGRQLTDAFVQRFDLLGHFLEEFRSLRWILPRDGRGAIDRDALLRDDVGAIAKIPPGSFGAVETRIQPANHVAIPAPQFSAIGEDLKRERAACFDQIAGRAAVNAWAAGVALGEVYGVAISRGISGDDGLSQARFLLARLDCHRPAGFVYGCDWGDGGSEDSVWAAGWRVLCRHGESGAAERNQR